MKAILASAAAGALLLPAPSSAQGVPSVPMNQFPAALLQAAQSVSPNHPKNPAQVEALYLYPLAVTGYDVVALQVGVKPTRKFIRTSDPAPSTTACDGDAPSQTYEISVTRSAEASASVTQSTSTTLTGSIGGQIGGVSPELAKGITQATSNTSSTVTSNSTTETYQVPSGGLSKGEGVRFVPIQEMNVYTNAPYQIAGTPTLGTVGYYQNGRRYNEWTGPLDLRSLFTAQPSPIFANGVFSGTELGDTQVIVVNMKPEDVAKACAAQLGHGRGGARLNLGAQDPRFAPRVEVPASLVAASRSVRGPRR